MTPFPSEDVIAVIILVIHCVWRLLQLLLLTIWTSICVSLQICSQIVLCVSSENYTIPVEEQQGVSRRRLLSLCQCEYQVVLTHNITPKMCDLCVNTPR